MGLFVVCARLPFFLFFVISGSPPHGSPPSNARAARRGSSNPAEFGDVLGVDGFAVTTWSGPKLSDALVDMASRCILFATLQDAIATCCCTFSHGHQMRRIAPRIASHIRQTAYAPRANTRHAPHRCSRPENEKTTHSPVYGFIFDVTDFCESSRAHRARIHALPLHHRTRRCAAHAENVSSLPDRCSLLSRTAHHPTAVLCSCAHTACAHAQRTHATAYALSDTNSPPCNPNHTRARTMRSGDAS